MLTDAKLRNLKPKERGYKVADRDGLYVQVAVSGGIHSDTTIESMAARRPSHWDATMLVA
jgi:hypothetical protein